jgi:hypothetical protein
MKKLLLLLIAASFSFSAFAQELKVSGEVKTGIYWQKEQYAGMPATSSPAMRNKDGDSGDQQGRYRLNLDYDNGNGFGMKARLQLQDSWGTNEVPRWPYAFGYGNLFEEQLTVSIGKLGASPWGTGGPEMWRELESLADQGVGMRIEYKPGFIPEAYGKLNVGFVLNWFNGVMEETFGTEGTLAEILKESIIGASYTHDLFLVRAALRFDSKYDLPLRGSFTKDDREGVEILYRVEEHIIKNYLPGFSVWALGDLQGVGTTVKESQWLRNWFFVQYDPDMFTAQVRLGYEYPESRNRLFVKPSFYWHFFNKLVSVGTAFSYAQDFGNKIHPGSPYESMEIEPKIQLNFSSSYIAFVYNFTRSYVSADQLESLGARAKEPIKQTQWMNLRFAIYY